MRFRKKTPSPRTNDPVTGHRHRQPPPIEPPPIAIAIEPPPIEPPPTAHRHRLLHDPPLRLDAIRQTPPSAVPSAVRRAPPFDARPHNTARPLVLLRQASASTVRRRPGKRGVAAFNGAQRRRGATARGARNGHGVRPRSRRPPTQHRASARASAAGICLHGAAAARQVRGREEPLLAERGTATVCRHGVSVRPRSALAARGY
jgi:hypothetical protein